MLRRRYYQKEKIAGKTKRREKTHAAVRNRTGSQRGFHLCIENGYLTQHSVNEPVEPFFHAPEKQETSFLFTDHLPSGYSSDIFPWTPAQSLCFTGHRLIPEKDRIMLNELLDTFLLREFQNGKQVFLSGGALGFDTLAAQAVLRLKKSNSTAKLVFILPCLSQSSRWPDTDRKIHQALLQQADRVVYISKDYYDGCMQKRNRFLVDHADVCCCYLKTCRGGTWYTVSYAYDQGRIIRNLAMELR